MQPGDAGGGGFTQHAASGDADAAQGKGTMMGVSKVKQHK